MLFSNIFCTKKYVLFAFYFTFLTIIGCEITSSKDEYVADPSIKKVDDNVKNTSDISTNTITPSKNIDSKNTNNENIDSENTNNEKIKTPANVSEAIEAPAKIPDLNLVVKARLIPGDRISVEVAGEDEMTRKFTLSKSGKLHYPYVKNTIATNKTVEELQEELTDKLTKFFVDPVVNVSVDEWAERRVFLYGVENGPNSTLLLPTKGITASQLLISAGISSKKADLSRIFLTRYVNNEKKVYPIPLEELLENYDLKRDIVLLPNDLIIVKEAPKIHIQGNVKSPGSFPIQQNQKLSLWHILSLAEGPTEDADLNNIKILRELKSGDIKVVFATNIEKSELIPLEPDDVIVIPSQNENIVTVYGQVKKPGTIKLQGKDTRLSNVIANAGGLTQYASRYIRVFRHSKNEKTQKFSIDFNAITSGNSKQDMKMQSGDIVFCDYGFW